MTERVLSHSNRSWSNREKEIIHPAKSSSEAVERFEKEYGTHSRTPSAVKIEWRKLHLGKNKVAIVRTERSKPGKKTEETYHRYYSDTPQERLEILEKVTSRKEYRAGVILYRDGIIRGGNQCWDIPTDSHLDMEYAAYQHETRKHKEQLEKQRLLEQQKLDNTAAIVAPEICKDGQIAYLESLKANIDSRIAEIRREGSIEGGRK